MRYSSSFIPMLMVLSASVSAGQSGCTPGWLPAPTSVAGCNGQVTRLHLQMDPNSTSLYLGGWFSVAGNTVVNRVARWNGTSFTPLGAGISSQLVISDMATFDDGTGAALYVALRASTSQSNQARVQKWDGTSWQQLGGTFDQDVTAVEVFNDGAGPKLFAAGSFTVNSGVPLSRIARWNGSAWESVGGGIGAGVRALRSFGGSLVATGYFSTAGGTPAARIAAWNGTTWSPLGTGLGGPDSLGGNGYGECLGVHDSGSGPVLVAGGTFSLAGGQSVGCVAGWNGSTWSPVGSGISGSPGFGTPATVYAVESFDQDGPGGSPPVLAVAGAFTSAAGSPAESFATWNGSNWTSAPAGSDFSYILSLGTFPGPAGPELIAGGYFSYRRGVSAENIARFSNGQWSSLGRGLTNGPGSMSAWLNGSVNTAVGFDDGTGTRVLAAGDVSLGGTSTGARVVRLDPLGPGGFGGLFNGSVVRLVVLNLGSGPTLFAVGQFTTVGSVAINNIAQWNGTAWVPVGSGLPGVVSDVVVHDDGSGPALVAGGDFTGNGLTRLARWNGSQWSAYGTANSAVLRLYSTDLDGPGPLPQDLYAAGIFTSVSGVPASAIARLRAGSWSSLGSGLSGFSPSGRDMRKWDGGFGSQLYVTGWFDSAGGVAASGVARWNGSTWAAVAPPLAAGRCDALGVFDDGTGTTLFVGGAFASNSTPPVGLAYLAKLSGGVFVGLSSGIPERCTALSVIDDGSGLALYVCGSFGTAGGLAAPFIGRWGCPRASLTITQPAGAGTPVYIQNSDLIPGHEYFNLFSTEPCAWLAGSGPWLGLCATDPSFLLAQAQLPVGAVPVHFLAATSSPLFGGYQLVPLEIEGICVDWTMQQVRYVSGAARLMVQ